jgi:hypothetical protein
LVAAALSQVVEVARPARGGRMQDDHPDAAGFPDLKMVAGHADLFNLHTNTSS